MSQSPFNWENPIIERQSTPGVDLSQAIWQLLHCYWPKLRTRCVIFKKRKEPFQFQPQFVAKTPLRLININAFAHMCTCRPFLQFNDSFLTVHIFFIKCFCHVVAKSLHFHSRSKPPYWYFRKGLAAIINEIVVRMYNVYYFAICLRGVISVCDALPDLDRGRDRQFRVRREIFVQFISRFLKYFRMTTLSWPKSFLTTPNVVQR